MGSDKDHHPTTTPVETLRIEVVCAWAKAHPKNVLLEVLLAQDNLRRHLAPPANLLSNVAFPLREATSWVCSRSPSSPVEGKGKKPRRISLVRADSDDFPIPPGGPSAEVLVIRPESSSPRKAMTIANLPRAMLLARGVVVDVQPELPVLGPAAEIVP